MSQEWTSELEYLGLVGGSSFLQSSWLKNEKFQAEVRTTRYGQVKMYVNRTDRVVFIQRHAADPDVEYSPPHLINKKAIVSALRAMNCKRVIAFNSTGSMKESIPLGSLVVPDDFICLKAITFFDDAKAHIVPGFNGELRDAIIATLQAANYTPITKAVYVQTEGPRFETPAEIRMYSVESDIVGMTSAHEAILCQEAGLQYASICMIDNWANGIQTKELTPEEFHDGVKRNQATMEKVLGLCIEKFKPLQVGSNEASVEVKESSRIHADQILHGRWVIPLAPEEEEEVLEFHSVVISNGKILDILPTDEVQARYVSDVVEDFSHGHVLMPGLINAHTHLGMTLLRGYSDDKSLLDWLQKDIWPAEGKFVSHEFVRAGTMLAIAEMIRSGTTCFNDMYFHPEATAEIALESGMRGVIGFPVFDVPSESAAMDHIETGRKAMERFRGKTNLLEFAICPHAPYTVGDNTLEKCREFAEIYNIRIHTHLHEQEHEVSDSIAGNRASSSCHRSETLMAPVENFHRLKLTGGKLIAVHMTCLSDEQIKLVKETGTNVVHCPSSNLKLASGFARVSDLLRAGVNVGLGTDSTASNNALDMFAEIKLAAILAKAVAKDSTALPAWEALRMATMNNARMLGLEKKIGSLEPGKDADIIAVKMTAVEHLPVYSVISHLVYSTTRDKVSDVWIQGRRMLRHYKLTTIDKTLVTKLALEWQQRIIAGREASGDSNSVKRTRSARKNGLLDGTKRVQLHSPNTLQTMAEEGSREDDEDASARRMENQ